MARSRTPSTMFEPGRYLCWSEDNDSTRISNHLATEAALLEFLDEECPYSTQDYTCYLVSKAYTFKQPQPEFTLVEV